MEISVGILAAQEINVFFRGEYREFTTSTLYTQKLKLSWKEGQVEVENTSGIRLLSLPLCFYPQEADSSTFELVRCHHRYPFPLGKKRKSTIQRQTENYCRKRTTQSCEYS